MESRILFKLFVSYGIQDVLPRIQEYANIYNRPIPLDKLRVGERVKIYDNSRQIAKESEIIRIGILDIIGSLKRYTIEVNGLYGNIQFITLENNSPQFLRFYRI